MSVSLPWKSVSVVAFLADQRLQPVVYSWVAKYHHQIFVQNECQKGSKIDWTIDSPQYCGQVRRNLSLVGTHLLLVPVKKYPDKIITGIF